MPSNSSRTSSSKKVSILYGDSPRTSYDSLGSRSSSEYRSSSDYSSRYSPSNMTTLSTYGGSSSTRYEGYSGSAFSRSSRSSNQSTPGDVVERLVRDPMPTNGTFSKHTAPAISLLTGSATASPHGYYAKDRTHTSGKTVTVHNHGKKSSRDEPRSGSSSRR